MATRCLQNFDVLIVGFDVALMPTMGECSVAA
jgi:hypothetical protein